MLQRYHVAGRDGFAVSITDGNGEWVKAVDAERELHDAREIIRQDVATLEALRFLAALEEIRRSLESHDRHDGSDAYRILDEIAAVLAATADGLPALLARLT